MIVSADVVEISHGLCHITGVTVKVRIDCNASSEMIDEESLASVVNAVVKVGIEKCEPTVAPLARQYRETSSKFLRSRLKRKIRKHHRTWIKDTRIRPKRMRSYCVDLMTKCAVKDIGVDHAVVGHSITLFCRVTTVEALSYLKQMIDCGRLSQLFSNMYTASANTGLKSRLSCGIFRRFAITATVILSTEEYSRAFESLTGKLH